MNKKMLGVTVFTICLFMLVGGIVQGQEDSMPWDDYDLEGETLTIMNRFGWGKQADFLTGENFDEGEHAEWKETVEEEFNVDIELVYIEDVEESLISEVMAGDPEASIYTVQYQNAESMLAPEGVLLPLDSTLEDINYYDRLLPMYRDSLKTFNTFMGETYMLQAGLKLLIEARAIVWNKDLFDREGLPDLYELYEDGEWTWDKFAEIAVEATRDTSGDGEIDQWGVRTRDQSDDPADIPLGWSDIILWAATNDGYLTEEGDDGIEEFAFDSPEVEETFTFLRDLYEKEVFTAADFHSEDVAMSFDQPGSGGILDHDNFRDMEDDYGVVPLPKGPSADEHKAPQSWVWTAIIPVTVENPEEVLEVYNALYKLTEEYVEEEEWNDKMYDEFAMDARDEETVENFQWIQENSEVLPFMGMPTEIEDGDFIESMGEIIMGEASHASVMNEFEPPIKAYLDEVQ